MDSLWRTPTQGGTTGTLALQLVPGVIYDWHENPAPQMGSGELSFGGDQGCRCVALKSGALPVARSHRNRGRLHLTTGLDRQAADAPP